MGVVYRATCSVTGKSYIGFTARTLEHRRKEHEGIAAVLAEASTHKELAALEIELIAEHKTKKPNGYNLSRGGLGADGELVSIQMAGNTHLVGHRHSEETKIKIGQGSKIAWASASPDRHLTVSARLVLSNKQREWTPEMCVKVGKATGDRMRGVPISEERKAKLRGRKRSTETRARMSEAAKRRAARERVLKEERTSA